MACSFSATVRDMPTKMKSLVEFIAWWNVDITELNTLKNTDNQVSETTRIKKDLTLVPFQVVDPYTPLEMTS
jgi:hypothetical protein